MTVIRTPSFGISTVEASCKRCSGLGGVVLRTHGSNHAYMVCACSSCNGSGRVVWTRGVSLTPLVPRR